MEKRIRVDKTPGKSILKLEEKLLNYDLLRDRRCDPVAPSARKAANTANSALHKGNECLSGLQIHEIQPVKFGGSPNDLANKFILTPSEHRMLTNWWNQLLRDLNGAPK